MEFFFTPSKNEVDVKVIITENEKLFLITRILGTIERNVNY